MKKAAFQPVTRMTVMLTVILAGMLLSGVANAQSNQAVITAFNFNLPWTYTERIAVVDNLNSTIQVPVYNTANLTSVAAVFTVSSGATVRIGSVIQTSGVTLHNYSSSVTLVVTSQDLSVTRNYVVSIVRNAISSQKEMLEFSFAGITGVTSSINSDYTVNVTVPYSTDLTSLIATFSVSPVAAVSVSGVAQVSGVTVNNFATTVPYLVTAENSSYRIFYVTVQKATARTENLLTSFEFRSFEPDITGIIDQANHKVTVTVPFSTNLTDLVPHFTSSPLSTVWVGANQQTSGTTSNSFAGAVTYTVKAEDGTPLDYEVTVLKAEASSGCDLTSFSFPNLTPSVAGIINQLADPKTVNLIVPYGTNLTNLVASFTTSANTTVSVSGVVQTSGVTVNNFTTDLTYRILAENGTSVKDYVVHVTVTAASTAKTIFAFKFDIGFDPDINGVINGTNINLLVPYGTNVTALVASFTNSPLSTVFIASTPQVSGVTANNFTSQQTYEVVAEDGTFQNYTVTVNTMPASRANSILTFRFDALNPDVIATISGSSINLEVPFSTNVTGLVATFTHSDFATVWVNGIQQVSGITANNFTTAVQYRCKAQDGSEEVYTVTVTRAAISVACDMLDFRFDGINPAAIGVVNPISQTIDLLVPFSTDVTHLVATFTSSPLSSVEVSGISQISGVSQNNFTTNLIYKVIAEDPNYVKNWTIRVIKAPANSIKRLLSFHFNGLIPAVSGVIDEATKTVAVNVPYGTNVTALVATFTSSPLSRVLIGTTAQVNGVTANNFTSSVTYKVVAEDGSFQNYVVTVTIYEMPKRFILFGISGSVIIAGVTRYYSADGVIDDVAKTINVSVPFSADRRSMAPWFILTDGVTAYVLTTIQTPGVTTNDCTNVLTYILLASDGSLTTYQVTVTSKPIESENHMESFEFSGISPTVICDIDQAQRTIKGQFPFGTNLSALVATFQTTSELTHVKVQTTLQVSGTTVNNFNNPVNYTMIAEDGSMMDYVVTLTVDPGSPEKEISYFAFEDLNPPVICEINQETRVISGSVPPETGRAGLVAYFSHSDLSTVLIPGSGNQESGISVNDFITPVYYEVIAQDGSRNTYTVLIYEEIDITPPTVFNTPQEVTNLLGDYVLLQSSESTGKVYIVLNSVAQNTVADLEYAVETGAGRDAYVYEAHVDILIETFNMFSGVYSTYAVDGAGNLSEKGTNEITIIDTTPPEVGVAAQTLSNAINHTVNVVSSEQSGTVYLIREGVPQDSKTQMDAAVAAGRGAKGVVLGANLPVSLNVYQLSPGNYHAYAVDEQETLSIPSANVVVITQASTLKSILSYSFLGIGQVATGQISGSDIVVRVPVGTDVTGLIGSFTLSPLSKAYCGLIEQISGVTPNNFSMPVIYTVEAEDGTTLDYTVTISFNTGIEDPDWLGTVIAYPNPFTDRLTIEMQQPADHIQIINSLGQMVHDFRNLNQQIIEIQSSTWIRGVYFVKFFSDGRYVGVQRVIRE